MINSIALKSFQSHEDSVLNFCPGVNTIVGQSDNGKSSVLRALRWVIENKPAGDSLKSYWSEKVAVEVEAQGHQIYRAKSKTYNDYVVDGSVLKAFRQGVPDEVTEAFQFHDVNLQAQMDSPFLLGCSPGEVARYLNDIMDLNKIDTALAKISSTSRELNREVKATEKQCQELETELKSYSWVDAAVTELEKLKKYESELTVLETELVSIQEKVNAISEIVVPAVPDLESNFEKVQVLENSLVSKCEENAILQGLVSGLQEIGEIKTIDLFTNFEKLDADSVIILEMDTARKTLQDIVKSYRENEIVINFIKNDLRIYGDQLSQLQPICPTCGQPIPEVIHG